MDRRTRTTVAAARIRSGTIIIIIGCVLLTLGVLGFMAGAGGAEGAAAFGGICSTLGAFVISFGLLVELFRKLEQRLIDIQQLVLAAALIEGKIAVSHQSDVDV